MTEEKQVTDIWRKYRAGVEHHRSKNLYRRDERCWHFYTGESSRQIYSQADGPLMRSCYLGFHTLDVAMAVEDLKEIYRQKQENKNS